MNIEPEFYTAQLQRRYAYRSPLANADAFSQGYEPHSGGHIIKSGGYTLIAHSMQSTALPVATQVDLAGRFFDFAPN